MINGMVSWRQHMVAAFVAVVLMAPLLWLIMDRQPPYIRESGTISPENPRPGDFIQVNWKLRVARYCPPSSPRSVTRVVVDSAGKIHDYDAVEGYFGTDRVTPNPPTLVRGFQLPRDIAPGPARYQSSACFACNPTQYLWPVCVKTPAIQFEIQDDSSNGNDPQPGAGGPMPKRGRGR